MATLEKLDGRHSLCSMFSHRVRFSGIEEIGEYIRARAWLTEHYGLGIERDLIWASFPHYKLDIEQPEWSWHNDDRTRSFIYLKDALVTHFSLKYLNT